MITIGTSTSAQLIAKGQAENKYNASGISSDNKWIDFFNDALKDLVDDMGLTENYTLTVESGVTEYELPDDYYSAILLFETVNATPYPKRRNYNEFNKPGYWIFNRGDEIIMDLRQIPVGRQLTLVYQKYATDLTEPAKNTQKPEVPRVGEKALVYYALQKALRNNSHLDDAKEYERLYEAERLKIRTAAVRGAG